MNRILPFINHHLGKRSKLFIIVSALILIIVIGFIDYLTGEEIAFSIFYILPIALATWFAGKRSGFLLAVVGAAVWLTADIHSSQSSQSYSHFVIPFWNSIVRLTFFLLVVYSLLILRNLLQRESDLARTDPLTNIANSRFLYELAEIELVKAQRFKYPLSVVYIDIDNFKIINDTMGHLTGDKLLRLVAQTIKNNVRLFDLLARVGGDEFVVMLLNTGSNEVKIIIDRLQQNLNDTMKRNQLAITFSIGVAIFSNLPDRVEALIKTADDLMYSAKSAGKNTIKYKNI